MRDRLDMYILNSLMDDSKTLEYLWRSANIRKGEGYEARGERLEKCDDIDYSKAQVLNRALVMWIEDHFMYPTEFHLEGQRYVGSVISDIEFEKIHGYYFDLTEEGRAEVQKDEYEPYWDEIRDD